MNNSPDVQTPILIRKYKPDDRQEVRRIVYETSFLEKAELFFREKEILADSLTLYFTDYEPESSFVACSDGKVVGYLIGVKDTRRMNSTLLSKVYPKIFLKALKHGIFFKKEHRGFFYNFFKALLAGEFSVPSFDKEFPAAFHINIDKQFRGRGLGEKLINSFLEYLKENGITAVHLSTMSEESKEFFIKMKFKVLHQSSRTYLRYRLGHDFLVYTLGRKID